MELFTLGIGNYTEDDIQQSARAFTGYRHQSPRTRPSATRLSSTTTARRHFLGKTGPFTGDDIIDIILASAGLRAVFIAKKLGHFTPMRIPSPALVEATRRRISAPNYEIRR